MPTRPSLEDLRDVALFAALPPDALESVRGRCLERRYHVGGQIVRHCDESSELFFLLEGTVRVVVFSASGREVSFRDLGAGEVFGEMSAIDGAPRSANVVALGPARIAVMSSADFRELSHRHAAVSDALLRHLVGLIRRYSQRVIELSTLGVEDRIHVELLRLGFEHRAPDNSATIAPAPTLAELASRVSTTREAVSREIARLVREDLLERRRDALVIRDLDRLNALVAPLVA